MFLTTPEYRLKPSFSASLSKRFFPPPHIFLLSNLPMAREFHPTRLSRFTFISTQFVNNVALYTSNPVLYPPQHHPVEPARCTWYPPHALLGLMHPLTQISFSTTPSSPIFLLCGRSHPNSQSLQGWSTLRVTRALIHFSSDHPEPATTTLRCPMMRCLPRA